MSIPVELPDLQAKTAEYTWAYLLTVRPDSTPHLVSLSTRWHDLAGVDAADDATGDASGAAKDDATGGAIRDATGGATDDASGGAGPAVDGGSFTDVGGRGSVLLMSVSTGTARNAAAGTKVTLCYPPLDHDGYSLIVDGTASPLEGDTPPGIDPVPDGKVLLRFDPTGAVLHRSAPPGFANSATGCANDCLPVDAPID